MSEEVKVAPEVEVAEAPVVEETTSQATEPFKAFTTEEEFNNFVKSTSSKAKNEILKALETNSVDEGKEKMSQAQQLEQDLHKAITRLNQLEEENALVKIGVQDEFREEALTLARAKIDDSTNLESALKQVTSKFPNLLAQKPKGEKLEKVGAEKGTPKPQDDAQSIVDMLNARYKTNIKI